jgi:hypothetical protein
MMSRFAGHDWTKQGLHQDSKDPLLSPAERFPNNDIKNAEPDVEAVAARLREAMARKGWSIGETARQASQFLSDGQRLGRPQIWHYMRGDALPRPHHLTALVRAFGEAFR